jgi:hypothetical protein
MIGAIQPIMLYFTNVSKQAGIMIEGYTHGVTISDFNRMVEDIYVTNDFLSNDVLYINNRMAPLLIK